MTKTEYVDARRKSLSSMTTENLAIAIGEYFDTHATMPGEKDLKDAAEKIVANIAENPAFDIDAATKESLIAKFADIVVREMKVEGLLVQNVNKANADDAAVLKPTNLGLSETASVPADGKKPAKRVYEAAARIENGKVIVGDYEIGRLSKGFVKNNPNVTCNATLIATDFSDGKFANMSYTLIADIAA